MNLRKTIPETVLIIDDDHLILNLLANYLESLGCKNITTCDNGGDAWELFRKQSYDFIFMDWDIPKVSGVALFNRIRSTNPKIPILVISGLINKHNFSILKEFIHTGLLEKPFAKQKLKQEILAIQSGVDWYNSSEKLINSFLQYIEHDNHKKTDLLISRIFKEKHSYTIPFAILTAKRLRHSKKYETAKKILSSVLTWDRLSLMAISELAKVQFITGDLDGARSTLQLAYKIAPENMERLCFMGEVELNSNNPELAKQYFAKAIELDPFDDKAKIGIEVANQFDSDLLLEFSSKDNIPLNLAGFSNIMGITQVRSQNFGKGIEYYHKALAYLSTNTEIAKVKFNLGLGFLRWGKLVEAMQYFSECSFLQTPLSEKAQKYINKISSSANFMKIRDFNELSVLNQNEEAALLGLEDDKFSFNEVEQTYNDQDDSLIDIASRSDDDLNDLIPIKEIFIQKEEKQSAKSDTEEGDFLSTFSF